jgi:diguanylate cyclase (GGDEF)-like protein
LAVLGPRIQTTHRILVVDDDPETARLLRKWYDGEPFEVFAASDGEEGVDLCRSLGPDLVVLDVNMPRLDGFETAKRLKADPATASIPVVLLTARRDTDDKVRGFASGCDDYVTKPFAFEEMDARVRAMLRKRELYVELQIKNRELDAANRQMQGLLVEDEKTGLANFREFQRRLREEWLRAERYRMPLSLVMLDLDDFKAINDTWGHPAGDRVLREFATLVAGGARATDLAARYGGEEFGIILPHTDGELALRVAERIRGAVEEFAFLESEAPIRVTVSGGVATWPFHPGVHSFEDLVRAADRALYRAKQSGKNRVMIDPEAVVH